MRLKDYIGIGKVLVLYKIVETDGLFGIKFKKYFDGDNIPIKEINMKILKHEHEGLLYLLLIDSCGNVIMDAFKYLNQEKYLGKKSYAKRMQAITALKFLYSFIELYSIGSINLLAFDDVTTLTAFLRGGYYKGNDMIYEIETRRCNDTINYYFSAYRRYYEKYFKIKDSHFSDVESLGKIVGKGLLGHTSKSKATRYTSNRKINERKEVPKYINYEEYLIILDIIKEKYGLREELICKLMYIYGLRIGEVLGLTIEDIEVKWNSYNIILRNRLSDKAHQHAKGCVNVLSKNDYESTEYNKLNVGFQIIPITKETFRLLFKYFDETTSPFELTSTTLKNSTSKRIADRVTKEFDTNNFYIFVSKNYTPITAGGWNGILRKIYAQAGIPIDKGKREHNLNHKLRHGFSMYKIYKYGFNRQELRAALRHKSESSVDYYYNPTEDDLRKLNIQGNELLEKAGINRKYKNKEKVDQFED